MLRDQRGGEARGAVFFYPDIRRYEGSGLGCNRSSSFDVVVVVVVMAGGALGCEDVKVGKSVGSGGEEWCRRWRTKRGKGVEGVTWR